MKRNRQRTQGIKRSKKEFENMEKITQKELETSEMQIFQIKED